MDDYELGETYHCPHCNGTCFEVETDAQVRIEDDKVISIDGMDLGPYELLTCCDCDWQGPVLVARMKWGTDNTMSRAHIETAIDKLMRRCNASQLCAIFHTLTDVNIERVESPADGKEGVQYTRVPAKPEAPKKGKK